MRYVDSVEAEKLFNLENHFSGLTIAGVGLGSTLNSVFTKLLLGSLDVRPMALLRDVFVAAKNMIIPIGGLHSEPVVSRDKLLITWISEKDSLQDMVLSLVTELGPTNCVVIGSSASMRRKLPAGTEFITWKCSGFFLASGWRRTLLRAFPVWTKSILVSLKKEAMTLCAAPSILSSMVVNGQRAIALRGLVEALQPRGVITEYDRDPFCSCLILAAKKQKIRTVTLQHGMANPPYGYSPLLADRIFCWGELQRKSLLKMGIDESCISITGAIQMTKEKSVSKSLVEDVIGLGDDQPVLLLLTNPTEPSDRTRLVQFFCSSPLNPRVQRVVRLHPSESLAFYKDEIGSYPNVIFLDSGGPTLRQLLSLSKIVCCNDSSAGLEAMLLLKPLVVLDVLDSVLRSSLEYVDDAGSPRVKNETAFSLVVLQLLSDTESYELAIKRQNTYVSRNYAAVGGEAAKLTVLELESFLGRGV